MICSWKRSGQFSRAFCTLKGIKDKETFAQKNMAGRWQVEWTFSCQTRDDTTMQRSYCIAFWFILCQQELGTFLLAILPRLCQAILKLPWYDLIRQLVATVSIGVWSCEVGRSRNLVSSSPHWQSILGMHWGFKWSFCCLMAVGKSWRFRASRRKPFSLEWDGRRCNKGSWMMLDVRSGGAAAKWLSIFLSVHLYNVYIIL